MEDPANLHGVYSRIWGHLVEDAPIHTQSVKAIQRSDKLRTSKAQVVLSEGSKVAFSCPEPTHVNNLHL